MQYGRQGGGMFFASYAMDTVTIQFHTFHTLIP